MTDEQILSRLRELVDHVTATSRGWYGKYVHQGRHPDGPLPEYYPGYAERVRQRDRIRVHAELDYFPEHLFRERAPRQSPEELAYLRANFKQTTLPVYLDYLATVQRVFHDANWSISLRDSGVLPEEDSLADYLEELPLFGTYEQYFKQYLPHLASVDANALVAYRPIDVPTVLVELADGTTEEVVAGERLRPVPVFFRCDQVVAEELGVYYLVELDQRSPCRYGNQTRPVGRIFEYYDREVIARATQVGNFTEGTYRYEIVYRHDWGRVPARKTGGIPQLRGGVLTFLSPFAYATDVLDVALLNEQYLNAIVSATVYPHKIMYGEPCEFENETSDHLKASCDSGRYWDGGLGSYATCKSCQGTGLRSRLSPLGVLLIKPPGATTQGDQGLPGDPLKFVAPDVEAPRFIQEKVDRDIHTARQILHLTASTTAAGGGTDPLATTQLLDQKAMAAFIKPISDNLFGHVEFGLQALGQLRYGELAPAVTVVYPTTFDFYTESDYLAQLANATKAGLPPFLVQTVLYRYLQSLYYNDAETTRIFETIVHADRLLSFSPTDVALLQARELATKAEVVLHDSALTLVEELRALYAAQGQDFLELPLEERVAALRAHAEARVPGATAAAPVAPPQQGLLATPTTTTPPELPAQVTTQQEAIQAVLAATAPTVPTA